MFIMILIAVVFFFIYFGAHFYVPFRLVRLLKLKRRKILYFISLAGAVSVIISRILQKSIASEITDFYYLISTIWLGFLFFILMFLLLFEILNVFVKIPSVRAGTVIVGLTVLVSLYAFWNAISFKVYEVEIVLNGLEKDLDIVHVSDIHIGYLRGREYLEKVVKSVNDQNPDLVLITGDLADNNNVVNMETLSPLKKISAPAFFTTGNHESYVDFDTVLGVVRECGVRVLRNEKVITHGIQLIGLDYMNADEKSFDMHGVNDFTIKKVLPEIEVSTDTPAVLMHHSPVGMQYVENHGVDLMVSGHTHAGQIFPMNIIIKLFFPYSRGLYCYNGMYLYVSQGAGTYGPPMRLGTKNEITLIRLKKQ